MGQKINPIALRLQSTNRNFDHCWYSDYFYSYMLSQDIKIRLYLNSILKQIQYPAARFYIQTFQKKTKIFVFFCSPKRSRKVRSRVFKIKLLNFTKLKKKKSKYSKKTLFKDSLRRNKKNINLKKDYYKNLYFRYFLLLDFIITNNKQKKIPIFFVCYLLKKYVKKLHSSYFKKSISKPKKNQNIINNSIDSLVQSSFFLKNRNFIYNKRAANATLSGSAPLFLNKKLQEIITYRKRFENILSKELKIHSTLYPIKTFNDYRSALFLAEEIVYFLQRRVPFRKIKYRILKEVKKCSPIKGVRICCSGRVGGRSKKAQKAKTETIMFGQTSLHVFSSQIDYASKTALTSFGCVGVKVWISFF